ncbi:MAG: vitamin B12 dependent-methionine synthase activation domain-containing protein, partial [Elusimicrobia bacterium]|nr:vitamin B12 dependent-methionine synthase activation domain-containing protein [Elusimicrobiota bacterium]
IAPRASSPVFHAPDAMAGLAIFNELFDPAQRAACLQRNKEEQERLRSAIPSGSGERRSPGDDGARAVVAHNGPIPQPPDLELHEVSSFDAGEVFKEIDPQMLYGKHLGLQGAVRKLFAEGDPKALELRGRVEELWAESLAKGLLRPRAAYRFCPCQSEGESVVLYSASAGGEPLARFDFPRQGSGERLCLADFVAPKSSGRMDCLGLFVVTAGAGVREETARLREAGAYFKSHALSCLALDAAEAAAEVLHRRLRGLWGIGARGRRFSFGYPACPSLEPQARLLELLESRRSVGVSLTEGFMMDPEASVSALVFHHPAARAFSAAVPV